MRYTPILAGALALATGLAQAATPAGRLRTRGQVSHVTAAVQGETCPSRGCPQSW